MDGLDGMTSGVLQAERERMRAKSDHVETIRLWRGSDIPELRGLCEWVRGWNNSCANSYDNYNRLCLAVRVALLDLIWDELH